MKKKFTKITSCLLCLAMLLSMAGPAMAAIAKDNALTEVFFEDLLNGEEIIFSPDGDDAIPIDAPAAKEDTPSRAASLPAEDFAVSPFAETGEYEIYPTPQSVTYGSDTVTLPTTMQVTYGAGIDQYTKDRAVEAFQQAGVTLSENTTTSIKLQVRIKGASETVTTATTNLFDKTSAYKLVIDNAGVTVIGKDTDAAFYGLTTMKRILQQVENRQVENRQVKHLTVEDYADVAFRGFIEGYYGNPWSTEDRVDLMEFGGELKMNIYFYAPKDDPKHNAQWRVPYTNEEIETLIQPLAEAGERSKCRFGYALHCFMHSPFRFDTEEHYQEDLEVLKAKYVQGIAAGARQIALLGDDAGVPGGIGAGNDGGDGYVKLLTDLTNWLKSDEMQTTYPGLQTSIPFCPAAYSNGTGNHDQLKRLNDAPEGVAIIMTGGTIYGTVNPTFLNTFKNNVGRGAYLWINWPCSDNHRQRLMMLGQETFLKVGVQPDTIEGIMLNPMQQSEPSKMALFCNADYAWNIWGTEQDGFDAWNDSFKYIESTSAISSPEADALRLLSLHMGYGTYNGRPTPNESVALWPLISAFRTAMSSSTLTDAQISELRAKYAALHAAAVLYKNKKTGNQRILGQRTDDGYVYQQEQMAPWLDCAEEFTQATIDLLDALSLIQNNADGSQIVNQQIVAKYLAAQSGLTASENHAFEYRGEYQRAQFGTQRLVPFTNDLLAVVAEQAQTIIDPTILVETIITNRTDVTDLSALRDGNDNTKITFTSPTYLSEGDYIGVRYNRPIPLNSVNFKLGDSSADGGKNTFGACKLQYTEDGVTWKDIPGDPTIVNNSMNSNWSGSCRVAEIGMTGLSLNAQGVRVISTEFINDVWIVAREIYINGQSGGVADEPVTGNGEKYTVASISKSDNMSIQAGTLNNAIDGNDSTNVQFAESPYKGGAAATYDKVPANAWVQVDLGNAVAIDRIVIVQDTRNNGGDRMKDAVLEYSTDGTTYTQIASNLNSNTIEQSASGVTARYVRFKNGNALANGWVHLAEFSVYAPTINDLTKIIYQSESVKKLTNPVTTSTDTSASLSSVSVSLRPGEFIGLDLTTIRDITEIVAVFTSVNGLTVKVGVSETTLEEEEPYSDGTLDFTGPARYIRLENTGSQNISFRLDELSVKFDTVEDIHFVETNIGTTSSYYNNDDARPNNKTGDWFDGDLSTVATFATPHNEGEYVLYDLGQVRTISQIDAVISSTAVNYVRFGEIQISLDGKNWTKVVEISTTADDSQGGFNTTPTGAGWGNYPGHPNYSYKTGTIEPTKARYLRLYITKTLNSRFPALGEIVINSGEYVSAFDDPAYTADPIEVSADFTPDKMRDKDLTTGFRPNMTGRTEGSISYLLSDETSIGQINIVEGTASGAKVSIRAVGSESFTELGTMNGGLGQFTVPENVTGVAEIKLTWGDVTPTFYEIITVPREAVAEDGDYASSDAETIAINSYAGNSRTFDFDENWKFNLGDASGAEAAVYNDASWRTLNLPHDFSIELDYTSAGEAESGYLPGGTGWYRKSFTIDSTWQNNKVISIDFGGAYMETEVYLNGHKLGENKNGYNPFSFVLPAQYLNYTGENVVAVKVVNTIPSSRWYSGSGIYRSVNLTVTDRVHVARYGTYVNPVKGTGNSWTVNVKTNVQNDGSDPANVTVEQAIYKLDGATYKKTGSAVTTTSGTAAPAANATADVEQTLTVSNPDLWNSWDRGEPNLYVLVTTVKQGDNVLDTYETEFGFRTIEFTTDVGFKLNGVNTKLKGVCQHHDQGALGAEAWYRALERQVEILMDMGCNSIRVTHNPAADELIEICNRKGVLVIDEAFDCWTKSKNGNSYDFARFFYTNIASDNTIVGGAGKVWSQFVLETMVNRDKNAPCVIMYSLGNEILTGAGNNDNPSFIKIIKDLVSWKEAIDMARPVTMGDDSRTTATSTNETGTTAANAQAFVNTYLSEHGVVGFNYCHTRGRDVMPAAHDNGWIMYGSETASHVNSRGVYTTKGNASLNSDKLLTSYDKSRVSWGDTVAGAWWYTILFDYNMGEYIWTGFDYIGEPTPANGTGAGAVGSWPSPKSSYFGAIDTNGLPKDSFWLYRALWNETDTTLHVLPTWDEDDIMLDSSGRVEVAVYSNAPVVRVYLNGVEVGASQADETTTSAGHKYRIYTAKGLSNGGANTFQAGSTAHSGEFTGTALYSTFMIPYQAGTLEVKAFDADGREITNTVGRDIVRTTDRASKLVTTADRATIKNDGRDLSYITIDVVDSKGEIVNGATNAITVSVSGNGVFMGLDNGVQPDHTSYLSKTRKAGAGQLVAIVQSTKAEGEFTLTASAAGLTPASVTVKTSGAVSDATGEAPVSYDLAKTFYVQLNTAPGLPETATVNLADGTPVTKNITWDEYDPSLLSTVGNEFAITGTIEDYNISVSVGVVVLDDVVALLNYSTAIQVGETPILPATRPAVMADGTVVSAQFPVQWNEPAATAYAKAGTVRVDGTAEAFGKTYDVTAIVRVAKPTHVEGSEAVVGTTVYEKGESKGTLATYNPAYADHNANTSVSVQGAIGYSFDTAQNIYKITLTYNGAPPTSGVTIALSGTGYQPTEEANNWQTVRATGVVSGNTVTYQLDKPVSTEAIKFTFANQVRLADILLTNGLTVFPVGTTAEFDGLKVNGLDVAADQLASKLIKTSAENAVITPVSNDNVAVTILPENSNSQIIVVTESEDHAERAVYIVQLDTNLDAEDASNDYPYTKTTATAPSQHGADTSANEGPAPFVVDGREASFWHSRWSNTDDATGTAGNSQGQGDLANYPDERYIQLTLQETTKLAALRYYPRTDASLNGTVIKYRVEVSTDGTNFTKVAEGDWARTHNWKIASFDGAVTAKYVRLYGVETYADTGNNRFMSCSELRVVTVDDRIDLSAAAITISREEPFHWKNLELRPGDPVNSNVDDDITVTVTLYGETLKYGVDYELDYDNNVEPGTAYLYARALENSAKYQGAAATTFQIEKTEDKITSFQPITLRVYPGAAPELPTEVLAIKEDQHRASVPVTWTWGDDVSEDFYYYPAADAVSSFSLNGTIEDMSTVQEGTEMPKLTLKLIAFQSADTVSLVTPVGVAPALPSTVTVRFADGTSAERGVTWNTDEQDWTTAETVTVTGDIHGISRNGAKASVRVAESTASDDNFAANTAVRGGATVGSLPLAIAWEGCPADNAFNATNGAHPNSTASGKKIWCDWEKNDYNNNDWFGVIFGNGDTLEVKTVNQVKLWFVQESAANGCKPPKSLKVQYYDGPDFTYYTQLSAANEDRSTKTNNMVSAWGDDHPFRHSGNWKDVSVTGSYPSSYAAGTEYAISFNAVSTKVIRVLFEHQDNQWIGLDEMEVYGLNTPVANSDFTVTSIKLGSADKTNAFNSSNILEVTLGAGEAIPTLAVTADNNASIAITQASGVPGAAQAGGAWAQAVITSEDGSTQKTYTVKFKREGAGDGYFITQNITSNADKVTIPKGGNVNDTITIGVARGYQLTDLWVTIADGDREGELLKVTNNTFTMPADNVAISAGVSPIVYKLTYELNGGTMSTNNLRSYTVESNSFTLRNPSRPGYIFVGWVGGGLTTPTETVVVSKGSIGDRTYIAVWSENSGIGGGGGNNTPGTTPNTPSGSGAGASAPATVGDVVTTTTDPVTGATTVTTAATNGVVTAVTTDKDGQQTAVIQVPENSGSFVDAVMPALDVDGGKTPEVKIQNNTGRPLSVTVPFNGSDTVVAVRQEADGTETVIPLSVVDEDGLRLKTQPGDQTIYLVDNKKDFQDVPDTHWAAKAVNFAASRELFNGVSASTFAPELPMNRAMMTTVLWRLAEKPEAALEAIFDDVQPDSYYEEAVAWGVATGVVKGTDTGFEPDTAITRETLATLLYRAAGSPTVVDEMPRRFTDGDKVADWAQTAMVWCIQNDIIKGYPDNTLGSKNVATRAEVATMIQRFVDHQV